MGRTGQCGADQALRVLGGATPIENELLSAFKYTQSKVILHTDSNIMPKNRRLWAGWNYFVGEDSHGNTESSFTYYMNKLQQVSKKKDYFFTVNDTGIIDRKKILNSYDYEHPIFDRGAIKAQPQLAKLNKNGQTYFCGSYFKYGFHEDAFRSGIDVCRAITGENIWA